MIVTEITVPSSSWSYLSTLSVSCRGAIKVSNSKSYTTHRSKCIAPGCASAPILAMRILALDHGTRRVGVAVSDEMKMIASPLEYIPAEPFANFLFRLKEILREKEVELILIGMPRNMDGSYGPATLKVQEFVAALKEIIAIPIKTLDERLTTVQAQKFLIQGNVRRNKRKEKVDKTAAAILLQSYLDSAGAS